MGLSRYKPFQNVNGQNKREQKSIRHDKTIGTVEETKKKNKTKKIQNEQNNDMR